jgi:dienelactone hydrolase
VGSYPLVYILSEQRSSTDIFGFFPQTIQGADILATSGPDREYRVFMPDFFEGSPADISWYPPQTEEHRQNLANFFQTKAVPSKLLSKIPDIKASANLLAPGGAGFKKWAILGYCFGGKVATLAVGKDNLGFQAAVQCHPAMVDPNDAEQVTVPMALLASGDEPAEEVKAYQDSLKVPNHVETFPTQIHGWMAARANLDDPEVRKEYERGYGTVLKFLHMHL